MEEERKDYGKVCSICQTTPQDTAIVYKNELWCSDHCRKVVIGEVRPTDKEWASMDNERYRRLAWVWKVDESD